MYTLTKMKTKRKIIVGRTWQKHHSINWPAAMILHSNQYLHSRLLNTQIVARIHQQLYPMNRGWRPLPPVPVYCSLIKKYNSRLPIWSSLFSRIYVCQPHAPPDISIPATRMHIPYTILPCFINPCFSFVSPTPWWWHSTNEHHNNFSFEVATTASASLIMDIVSSA